MTQTEARRKVATAAAIRKIAEMTAKYSTGKRRQEALDHLKKLDAEAADK